MSDTIDTALVTRALDMAVLHRDRPHDLLFHSDRGVQYAAGPFRCAMAQAGLLPSMSWRGNCYDNATMESFWSTLSREEADDFCRRHRTRRPLGRSPALNWGAWRVRGRK